MEALATMAGPRCWGLGLARTGTTTFCEALSLLGYRNVAHNPRFEDLVGLDGGADNGVVVFYKYLDYKYAGSKFVLLQRDIGTWLDSMQAIMTRYPVLSRDEDIPIMRRMILYESVAFDRDKLAAAYARHVADVRRYFADRPGDLLEMNISAGEGWDRLCPFLGLPVPAQPFPHLNTRASL